MPGVSGASSAPIVVGSYGGGQATISQGVWFIDQNHLTFDNLKLGPAGGLQGGNNSGHHANNITVQRCTIDFGSGASTNPNVGIYAMGNDWTIQDNAITNIGNSGMLLEGDTYTISGNTITHTGVDSGISYGKHGIYLKVSNATVTGNDISYFAQDAVSPRMRNSTISGNVFSHGAIGIGFYQYDATAGTSRWTDNTITDTSAAGIYTDGGAGGLYPTRESFVITDNTIQITNGDFMNLQPTTGTYSVSGNRSS
jgi:Right handed beta helix region